MKTRINTMIATALLLTSTISFAKNSINHTDSIDDQSLLREKLEQLQLTNNSEELNTVLNNYFTSRLTDDILNAADFNLFIKYVNNINAPVFTILLKNQKKYAKVYGKKKVAEKIFNAYLAHGKQIIRTTNNQNLEAELTGYFDLLNERNAKNYYKLKGLLTVELERKLGNWKEYISTIYINELKGYYQTPDDVTLYSWAIPIIYSSQTDEESIIDASEWLDRAYWACNKSDSTKLFYLTEKLKLLQLVPSMHSEIDLTKKLISRHEKNTVSLSSISSQNQ